MAEKKKGATKYPMSNVDVAAAADEMHHLVVGTKFSSFVSVAELDTKESFEIRLANGCEGRKQGAHFRFMALPALGEHASTASENEESPFFSCLRETGLLSESAPQRPENLPVVGSCVVKISPFGPVNGFRCHLKSIDVTNGSFRKQKLTKNRFAEEVSMKLKDHYLEGVTQVANDRVVAFFFSSTEPESVTFSYTECPCEKCGSKDTLLRAAVSGDSSSLPKPTPRTTDYILYIELYAGNMVLVDSRGRISSVLFSKNFDKSAEDPRRREVGMVYNPYSHNNVSSEAVRSIGDVIRCASLLSSSLLYDSHSPVASPPPLFDLGREFPSLPLPSISARLAIEVFRERKQWNAFCTLDVARLQQLRDSIPKRRGSFKNDLQASVSVLTACLHSQLSLLDIDPIGNTFAENFSSVFTGAIPTDSLLNECLSEMRRASPSFWGNNSSIALARKQQNRCFIFTTTIQNTNSIHDFFSKKPPAQRDHVSNAASHFTKTLTDFLDQFRCKIGPSSVVSLTKVFAAFILGIPLNGFLENTLRSPGENGERQADCQADENVFDFTKPSSTSGDNVFETLKRCLSQFDNMGPVLSTHCLVSAWDDCRSTKLAFQKSCLSAASSLVKHYETAPDVSSFMETPIPCPSTDVVTSAPPETQLAFLSIQQSIHEVTEEATTTIPKSHQGRADLAPVSMLRALASVRLQQRLLHSVKPSANLLFERINTDATEEADVARAEECSALANALLAPNLKSTETDSRLTTRRCVEALFEAIPTIPTLEILTDALCTYIIAHLLAPYVADTCVALHHPLRQNGNTFVKPAPNGGWVWIGKSYSPLAAGGVTFFGERSLEKAPSTFLSEEIQKLKRMMISDKPASQSEEEGETYVDDNDEESLWSELGDPDTNLGVGNDLVFAFAEGDEAEDFVTDAIEVEGSPTVDTSTSKKGVSFSPSTCGARNPTRDERKRKEIEAREAEQQRMKIFTGQRVVINPFAAEASDDDESFDCHSDKSRSRGAINTVTLPDPTSTYEYYYPALRALSDLSVVINENVNSYRQSRQRARQKYEELARKIENSKAYVAATCSKPFLFKALGFGKSSLRSNKGSADADTATAEGSSSPVTLSAGSSGEVSYALKQRLDELDRKKSVVLARAHRLYVLPPVSPVAEHTPLRPPPGVSATLPSMVRVGPAPTPSTLSPQLRPKVGESMSLPPLEICTNKELTQQWPLHTFLLSIISPVRAELPFELIRAAQRDFFDFSGVGRSLEYFYAAAQLSTPKKVVADAPGDTLILSAAQSSDMFTKVFAVKAGGKGKLKASDMVENTLKKHEERKSNLENTAKGYHINGNTLIAFADVVNAVLGTVASLVSQGSSWSAIETTFQERKRLILEEASAAERRWMGERGYEGRVESYYERKYEWEHEQHEKRTSTASSKAKLTRALSDDDDIYSDEDEPFPEEMPTEDEELNLVYYFEHQDELDPPPATKEELIERLFGPEHQWLFRVVTSLNLAESSVTVSLPKVVDEDVPLERDPEMIDIDVTFTDTAYANANAIFKRKKEVDVKVSKAHQADDLVREGAKRRALQKQTSDKIQTKKSKPEKDSKQRHTFREDLLYQEAQTIVKKVPQPPKLGSNKQIYVPIPHFKISCQVKGSNGKEFMPSNSSISTMSRSRSMTSGYVAGRALDPILFTKSGNPQVPEIDHVKGVRVLEDFKDPVGEFECKSFWFMSSQSKVEAIPCDPSVSVPKTTLLTSFLILHPRDAMGAVKLLNDELGPHDLVIYTDDPQADGALPVLIKSRTVTVSYNDSPVQCRLSFSSSAIEQAASIMFARSKMWSQRCTGRAFWCYGAQLAVRTKEENSCRSNTNIVPPIVLQSGIQVTSQSHLEKGSFKVDVNSDTGSYLVPVQIGSTDPIRCSTNSSLYSVSFSCYFFDVVRGGKVNIPPSSQPLRLGLGLMFKECVSADFSKTNSSHDETVALPGDLQCSTLDLQKYLSLSPFEVNGHILQGDVACAVDHVHQRSRSKLWQLQKSARLWMKSNAPTVMFDDDLTCEADASVPPYSNALLDDWTLEPQRPPRVARQISQSNLGEKVSRKSAQSASPVPEAKPATCEGKVDGMFSAITAELQELVTSDPESSVEKIFKKLKSHSELSLQQLLLYFVVSRKLKSLTSEEKSREAQRKKDANKPQKASGKDKQAEKADRSKGGQKAKKSVDDDDEAPVAKQMPKTDVEVVSMATGMSKTFVENTEKDVKRQIKQKESDLREDEFSESESEGDDVTPKGRQQGRKGVVKSKSFRHVGLRMLIADEILKQPKQKPIREVEKVVKPSPSPMPSAQRAGGNTARIETARDTLFSTNNSRMSECWEKELRWLTGRPQHLFATPEEDGQFGISRSTLEYCIPVIAPLQSFALPGTGVSDRFKYVVELQPAGQGKASSRASGINKDTAASSGKKGTTSNFKHIFDTFVRRVGACVTTSYRNDYWACLLQGSAVLIPEQPNQGDTSLISNEQLSGLSSLASKYIELEQTALISNEVEAALLERISANSTKYFQRVWEVSTSVSEMVDHPLRAVVSKPTCTLPEKSLQFVEGDAELADLLQGNTETVQVEVRFFKRDEVGRIDFNSAIVGTESTLFTTAFSKAAEGRLLNI